MASRVLRLVAAAAVLAGAASGEGAPATAFAAIPHVSLRGAVAAWRPPPAIAAQRPRARALEKRGALRSLRAVATGAAPNGVANKVALVALGCPKNTVDAEVMLGDLQKKGFQIVRQPRDADVVIVNTCTFVEDAKSESIQAVLEAVELKSTTAKGVVVTGCMAQRYADELVTEMPEVDAVVGFESYADISSSIERIISQSGFSMPEVSVGTTDVPFRPEWERVRITQQHSAFIRVAEGCDHKCTFCAIPSWYSSVHVPACIKCRACVLCVLCGGECVVHACERARACVRVSARVHDCVCTRPSAHWIRIVCARARLHIGFVRLHLLLVSAVREGQRHVQAQCGAEIGALTHAARANAGMHQRRRGRFRSKGFEAIMNEARMLASCGVTELNLIAEDTNQWGQDFGQEDPRRLADLLHSLDQIPQIRRISLLYCYPSYFSDELIDAIASIDKVCKYVDIPLQHISDPVLKAMNRPPMQHTKALLQKLRDRIPVCPPTPSFFSRKRACAFDPR